jgi:hypothetical protein
VEARAGVTDDELTAFASVDLDSVPRWESAEDINTLSIQAFQRQAGDVPEPTTEEVMTEAHRQIKRWQGVLDRLAELGD